MILRRSHAVPGGDIYQKCVACAELHGVCLRAIANVVEKAPPLVRSKLVQFRNGVKRASAEDNVFKFSYINP